MKATLKTSIIALFILLSLPIFFLLNGWNWNIEFVKKNFYLLALVTESAGFPYAVITCGFLALIFAYFLKPKTFKKFTLLICILAFGILGGQVIKSVTKKVVAEPRPFVVWFQKEHKMDNNHFYSLAKKDRIELLEKNVNKNIVPHFLLKHWKKETSYSFPSGHTLFAVTWAFLALLFLGFQKHKIVVSLIFIWAFVIQVSRLVLGVHYVHDLVASIILAWIISLFCYFLYRKLDVIK